MDYGYAAASEGHDPGEGYWERPARLAAIRESLAAFDVEYANPPPATLDDIRTIHDPDYISRMRAFCAAGGGDWGNHVAVVSASWDAALASAGLAVWAAERALDGAADAGTPFALCRPPGHHATPGDAMGFCVFNNAAIAAQRAIDRGLAERVAILDWDIHHGNGIQDAFYDRDDVLYVSLHDQGIYPCTGSPEETGVGAGEGATINVALPPGSGDVEYLAAFERVVTSAVSAHGSDLLLVSAGFDCHGDDAVSRMTITTDGLGSLAARTRGLADEVGAALGFLLEGGYDLDSLVESVTMVQRVFDGEEPTVPDGEPNPAVEGLLDTMSWRVGSLG